MAFTIASSVSPTASSQAPTGRPMQGHIQYAVNQGAYWAFWLSSTSSLNAAYSTNGGTTWNTPTGSPFTLANPHGGFGRNFATCYANLSSTDVLHMDTSYIVTGNDKNYHTRFTLGTTLTATNAEAAIGGSGADQGSGSPAGPAVCLDSASRPFDGSAFQDGGGGNQGNWNVARASNADAGTSWTAGFAASVNVSNGSAIVTSGFLTSLGSAKVLSIADNQSSAGGFTQLQSNVYSAGWGTQGNVLAATVTSADANAWGAAQVSATDSHVVALSNNSNAYVHRRYSGSAWASNTTVPATLAYGTNSGIALVSDGTNLWAFAIDTSKNIQYNKFTPASATTGTWGGWNVLEATRTNVPSYITGCYSAANNAIMVGWSEVNGTNFDVIGSVLSLGGAPPAGLFRPATLSLGSGGPFFQTPVNG